MKVIELNEEYERSYFACLEDWSDEIKEAESHKEQWYRKMKDKGLGVKLAINDEEKPANWIKSRKEPELNHDKVTVTGFISGWCPAYNMVFERAKRASLELGNQVVFREINTFDKEVFDEWGISDSLFINRKKINTGPPPSYKKIRQKISKELNHLNSS